MALPRPTRLAFFLALAGFIIGTAAMNTGNNLLYLVFSLLLMLTLVCLFLSSFHLRKIEPQVIWPEDIFAGKQATARLEVANPRRTNLSDLEISVQIKRRKTRLFLAHFPFLGPRENLRIKAPIKFPLRGKVVFKPLKSKSRFPFGFFTTYRRGQIPPPLTVFPSLLDDPTPTPRADRTAESGNPGMSPGRSTDLRNLRPYNPGDDPRQIHWKASAKTGQYLIKEHARPAVSSVHIHLDQLLQPGVEADFFEKAISRAATWVVDLFAAGVRVSFTATEHKGPPFLERKKMLDFLAEAKASQNQIEPPFGSQVFSAKAEATQ